MANTMNVSNNQLEQFVAEYKNMIAEYKERVAQQNEKIKRRDEKIEELKIQLENSSKTEFVNFIIADKNNSVEAKSGVFSACAFYINLLFFE